MKPNSLFRPALILSLFASGALAQGPVFSNSGPGELAKVLFPGETFHFQPTASGSGQIVYAGLEIPAGMSLNGTGALTWSVQAVDLGVHHVKLEASDSSGTSILEFDLAVESDHFQLQQLDYPGANNTQILGTNHLGQVVGTESAPAQGLHGFIWDGTTFTSLKFPGAIWTLPYDITDAGDIVGTNYDFFGWHGFRWSAGTFTSIPYSGYEDHPYSSTNSGLLTGWRISSPNSPSFAYSDLGSISYPDTQGSSKLYSRGFGINEVGQSVGDYFQTGVIGRRGFVFDQATQTTEAFEIPGGSSTSAYGINDGGEVVGSFASFLSNGYVGSSSGAFYSAPGDVTHLRRLGIAQAWGRVHALDVDNAGVVVGRFEYAQDDFHGFIATPIADYGQVDLGGASPNGPSLTIEGQPLYTGNQADLELTGAAPNSIGILMVGAETAGLALAGGQLLVSPSFQMGVLTDGNGSYAFPAIPGGAGPQALAVQIGVLAATNPAGFALSNAVRAVFLP